jgi:Flp pilus assembly protein TadD
MSIAVDAGAPAKAQEWRCLGDASFAAGRIGAAIANYEHALRLHPDDIEVHNLLGIAFERIEEWNKAETCFRQAIRIDGAFAPAYNNLGGALRRQGKWEEALSAFSQAQRLQPDNPDITFNLGVVHHDLGRFDQAVDFHRRALRLRPGSVDFSNSLAAALKEQGLLSEAIAQFRETLRIQSDNAFAYANLAEFAAEGYLEFEPGELERIKSLLDSGRHSAPDRNLLSFALGAVHQRRRCYDEAFRYFKLGNDLKRNLLVQHNLAFDPQAHHALVDRIIAAHGRSFFQRVKKWGVATDLPIFIVGMPRSGTTLVEQILASHPQVFGAGELDDICRFIRQCPSANRAELYTKPLLPNLRVTRNSAADYLTFLAGRASGAARVTVKTNENFLHLGLIATLFPRARIIHCRRDPLDVCLSCYSQNFNSADFAWSLEDIGAYYRAYERVMAHWCRVLPIEIHDLRYEELVHDQEKVTRELLAFCGLTWEERCLAFYNTRRAVRTASTLQVRKPISDGAIGRWRHYRAHLGPLFQALGRPAATEDSLGANGTAIWGLADAAVTGCSVLSHLKSH